MKIFGFIPISIFDVIDVFLMSVFIYTILRVLTGTKVLILIMSIGLLFFVGFLGQLLQLPSISLLVSTIKTFGVVILIIVFQTEIRRILMQIGSTPLIRFFVPEERVPIDEIIGAVEELIRRRLGALIVIERRISLNELTEDTGIILDAKLSAPLLVAIFDKKSPLHDGAVIIKNDRIVAASVMVPMSVRYKGIGARHRAGAGITEVTDAVSIVISEEKGTITFFNRGEAYFNLTLSNLRRLIEKSLRYESLS